MRLSAAEEYESQHPDRPYSITHFVLLAGIEPSSSRGLFAPPVANGYQSAAAEAPSPSAYFLTARLFSLPTSTVAVMLLTAPQAFDTRTQYCVVVVRAGVV